MIELNEEKVFYKTGNNLKLCGLLSKVNNDKSIVLMCHGLGSSKNEKKCFIYLVQKLIESNINSFRFDFRGHSESEGSYEDVSMRNEKEDLEYTIKYLNKLGFTKIIILGASFGAGIVSLIDYKNIKSVKGLVTWYPGFDIKSINRDDYTDECKEVIEKEGHYYLVNHVTNKSFEISKNLYDDIFNLTPYEYLIKNDLPLLIIHGTSDTSIPYTMSEMVHNLYENSQLILIEGGEHFFCDSPESLEKAIDSTIEFIKNI